MPTYVYETIPSKPGEKPVRFEYKQSMRDVPLKHHPETGQRVKRVISGGYGFRGSSRRKPSGGEGNCCSGRACDCA